MLLKRFQLMLITPLECVYLAESEKNLVVETLSPMPLLSSRFDLCTCVVSILLTASPVWSFKIFKEGFGFGELQ